MLTNEHPTTSRHHVLSTLAKIGTSRRELARRVAAAGYCSESAVLQWLSGHTKNPGLATWVGVTTTLDAIIADR